MTLEKTRIDGADARAMLESHLFRGAWDALNDHLNAQELACDPDNSEKARRIIISKQLLVALKREFERQVDSGLMARVQLDELEKKRKLRIFQR